MNWFVLYQLYTLSLCDLFFCKKNKTQMLQIEYQYHRNKVFCGSGTNNVLALLQSNQILCFCKSTKMYGSVGLCTLFALRSRSFSFPVLILSQCFLVFLYFYFLSLVYYYYNYGLYW